MKSCTWHQIISSGNKIINKVIKMDNVLNYYKDYDEDKRLEKTNLHKIEYLTTLHFLDKFITPNSKVLDLCAGTGAYSFYLESRGHSVTAVDIVPKFVEILRQKKKELSSKIDIHLGDARDLKKLNVNDFDVVLCMGALYHLKNEVDRGTVINECRSVLKENGIVVSSYINRYASFVLELIKMKNSLDTSELTEILNKGYKSNTKEDPFYGSSPYEIDKLMKEHNIEKISNIGVDGIGYLICDKILNFNDEEYKFWLETHYNKCEDENIIGCSLHGLYIGRKKR